MVSPVPLRVRSLRQGQRHRRRLEQRPRRRACRPACRRGAISAIAGDDAVVVLERIGEAERAARVGAGGLAKAISGGLSGSTAKRQDATSRSPLRIDDGRRPWQLHLALDGGVDRRAVGGARRHRRGRGDLVSPAASMADHVEVVGAAGADRDDAAGRHGIFGARRLAPPRRSGRSAAGWYRPAASPRHRCGRWSRRPVSPPRKASASRSTRSGPGDR